MAYFRTAIVTALLVAAILAAQAAWARYFADAPLHRSLPETSAQELAVPLPVTPGGLDRWKQEAARAVCALNLKVAREQVQIYYLDHGRFPSSWDELVPAYLDSIPRCPLAAIVLQPAGAVILAPK